jgi:hypothetical protein
MKVSDDQAWALYLKIAPHHDPADSRERADIVRMVRLVIAADSYREAVDLLRRASWGDPEGCAADLRGLSVCPHCRGDGVL